jgi:hypothetical protein
LSIKVAQDTAGRISDSKTPKKDEKVQISFPFLQANLNKMLYIAALFLTPAYRERYD